jgi:hypothetical protein
MPRRGGGGPRAVPPARQAKANKTAANHTKPRRVPQLKPKRQHRANSTARLRYSFSISDGQTAAGVVVSYDGKRWHAIAHGKYLGVFSSLRKASRALPQKAGSEP